MQLPTITKQQESILRYIYKFRFLERTQIQALLHHKTHNRINIWLKDLTHKNYIGKVQNNAATIQTTPNIYFLSKNGIKFLKTQSEIEKAYMYRLYSDGKRSFEFIHRSLFIANIYLYLVQKHRNSNELTFYTQSDFTIDGIIREIFPCFVYRTKDNKPYYVAEIFSESIPRFAIRAKITRYLTFFSKGDWIKNELSPNILFICYNDKQEGYIYKRTLKLQSDEDCELNIYVTTKDKIQQHGMESDIWMKVEQT